ncbi:MAG TPA: ribonuclease Z, partial [Spirochaetia bacterium]|nr:ribonuclease Z [Spirochaetia bacterium]
MIEEIQVLGAGTILPLPGYGCSGYVVRSGGRPILMDCGSGTLDRLAAAAVPVESIDLVLITHFHPDHVADLGPIILSRWLRNLGGSHELTLVGPVGLSAYLQWLTVQAHPWIDDYRLNIVELGEELPEYRWPGGEDSAGALTVRARRTVHTDSSICYRLTDDEGTVLFYSGDTDYDETLTSIMKDADLAVV